jgi:hypothetical protein
LGFIFLLILAVFGKFFYPKFESDYYGDDPGYSEASLWSRFHFPTFEVPHLVKHPLGWVSQKLSPDVVKDLSTQISTTKNELDVIKAHSKLDHETISKIEKALPDFIATKTDSNGYKQIPLDIWHAIKDRIQGDPDLRPDPHDFANEKPESLTEITTRDFEKRSKKVFDKWLTTNRAKTNALTSTELKERFPELLKENTVATKEEIIDTIRQYWDDNQKEVQEQMATVTKNVEQQSRHISKLLQKAGQTAQQVKASVEKYIKEELQAGKLEALSRANTKASAIWGNTRVNHWSHGTGATIDPNPTSKNYQFPSMKQGIFQKAFRYMIRNPVPIPNPPEAALTKWDEHGDCWCTDAGGLDGLGASIGVLSGSSIYPEQVVVEHIAPTASLEPGAAPKDMELWAYIDDFELYDTVKELSREMFPPESREVEAQETLGYVRVATWTYDIESPDNIQAFPVQLDLKGFSAHTNKLIIRAKNNWGAGNVDYTCLYRLRVHGDIAATPGL